ncbi:predicted protein, partial [Nematostella vectensis]
FRANDDRYSSKLIAINPPIQARFLRVNPQSYHSWIALRVEFYGCKADPCDVPLGVEDGRVTKQGMTASSMVNTYYGPWSGRLQARNHGRTRGGWVAQRNDRKQWLQVDLGT